MKNKTENKPEKKLYLNIVGCRIPEQVSVCAKIFNHENEKIVEYYLDYDFSFSSFGRKRRAYENGCSSEDEINYHKVPHPIRRNAYKLARKCIPLDSKFECYSLEKLINSIRKLT